MAESTPEDAGFLWEKEHSGAEEVYVKVLDGLADHKIFVRKYTLFSSAGLERFRLVEFVSADPDTYTSLMARHFYSPLVKIVRQYNPHVNILLSEGLPLYAKVKVAAALTWQAYLVYNYRRIRS